MTVDREDASDPQPEMQAAEEDYEAAGDDEEPGEQGAEEEFDPVRKWLSSMELEWAAVLDGGPPCTALALEAPSA